MGNVYFVPEELEEQLGQLKRGGKEEELGDAFLL